MALQFFGNERDPLQSPTPHRQSLSHLCLLQQPHVREPGVAIYALQELKGGATHLETLGNTESQRIQDVHTERLSLFDDANDTDDF
jgi:hypothetical protein